MSSIQDPTTDGDPRRLREISQGHAPGVDHGKPPQSNTSRPWEHSPQQTSLDPATTSDEPVVQPLRPHESTLRQTRDSGMEKQDSRRRKRNLSHPLIRNILALKPPDSQDKSMVNEGKRTHAENDEDLDDDGAKDPSQYHTSPSIADLKAMDLASRKNVEKFRVTRDGVAWITWQRPVNLSNDWIVDNIPGNLVRIYLDRINLFTYGAIPYPWRASKPHPLMGIFLYGTEDGREGYIYMSLGEYQGRRGPLVFQYWGPKRPRAPRDKFTLAISAPSSTNGEDDNDRTQVSRERSTSSEPEGPKNNNQEEEEFIACKYHEVHIGNSGEILSPRRHPHLPPLYTYHHDTLRFLPEVRILSRVYHEWEDEQPGGPVLLCVGFYDQRDEPGKSDNRPIVGACVDERDDIHFMVATRDIFRGWYSMDADQMPDNISTQEYLGPDQLDRVAFITNFWGYNITDVRDFAAMVFQKISIGGHATWGEIHDQFWSARKSEFPTQHDAVTIDFEHQPTFMRTHTCTHILDYYFTVSDPSDSNSDDENWAVKLSGLDSNSGQEFGVRNVEDESDDTEGDSEDTP